MEYHFDQKELSQMFASADNRNGYIAVLLAMNFSMPEESILKILKPEIPAQALFEAVIAFSEGVPVEELSLMLENSKDPRILREQRHKFLFSETVNDLKQAILDEVAQTPPVQEKSNTNEELSEIYPVLDRITEALESLKHSEELSGMQKELREKLARIQQTLDDKLSGASGTADPKRTEELRSMTESIKREEKPKKTLSEKEKKSHSEGSSEAEKNQENGQAEAGKAFEQLSREAGKTEAFHSDSVYRKEYIYTPQDIKAQIDNAQEIFSADQIRQMQMHTKTSTKRLSKALGLNYKAKQSKNENEIREAIIQTASLDLTEEQTEVILEACEKGIPTDKILVIAKPQNSPLKMIRLANIYLYLFTTPEQAV